MAKKALQFPWIWCRIMCFSNRVGFVCNIDIKAFGEIVKIGN